MIKNLFFSSINDLKIFLKDKSFKNIYILAGNNSYEKSGAKNILKNFLEGKNIKFFFKKNFYPVIEELNIIISEIKKFNPDLIISVGGGSVLDYAKIANSLYDSKNLISEIKNSNYKINKRLTKLLAIPTTAGSGAEVTSNAVIYINNVKFSVEGDLIKPNFFFLIPELVIGASNKIKSSAGFDAIAQAIESIISKKSNEQSIIFAQKSLKISLKYYLEFLKKPNEENTSAMCTAANLSGEAISISKTTAPHAVSYSFTSLYGISHGHAVSLTLNKFLMYNFNNIYKANCDFNLNDRYKILFNLTNTKNILELNEALSKIKLEANLENDFKVLGIDLKNDFSKFIEGVNISRLSNNPIKLDYSDLKNIILNEKNN